MAEVGTEALAHMTDTVGAAIADGKEQMLRGKGAGVLRMKVELGLAELAGDGVRGLRPSRLRVSIRWVDVDFVGYAYYKCLAGCLLD